MDRRDFLGTIGGGLLAAPLAAAADEGKIYRIGLLMTPPFQPGSAVYQPMLIAAMQDLGYVEGRNLVIEVRSADRSLSPLSRPNWCS